MQPPPPSLRRCSTASTPDVTAQRLTLNRAALLLPKTLDPFSAPAPAFGFFYVPGRRLSALTFIITPGGNRADKELYNCRFKGKFYFYYHPFLSDYCF